MPAVMIAVGIVAGVAGLIVMHVAAGHKKSAESVYRVTKSVYGDYASTAKIDAAVSMGHLGLGLLIAGGAVVLAGVVVVAIRRP